MKLIYIIRLAFAFIFPLMICFQHIIFSGDMSSKLIETKLTKLTGNIASAKEKMNNAREQLLDPEIDLGKDKKNIEIIIEQNQIIVNAEHILKKSNEILMKELSVGQEEPGYFDTLKDIGSGIFDRIKSLYSYTDDEKEIAQQIINGLQEQKKLITHEIASKVKGLLPILRDAWLARYNAIVEQFDAEIYKQQIITGQAMSFGKKVALATITGAVAAGLAFASSS